MNWIFAGLLCAHFDIYIANTEVLPNWLGYLFILWGMRGLMTELPAFNRARFAPLLAGLFSVIFFGARFQQILPSDGWGAVGIQALSNTITFAVEVAFWLAVRASERQLQTELDDAAFFRAAGITWLFSVAGAVLRWVENDIFAMLTTIFAGLLSVWLFYALWQIRKNYRYAQMQQAFERARR